MDNERILRILYAIRFELISRGNPASYRSAIHWVNELIDEFEFEVSENV